MPLSPSDWSLGGVAWLISDIGGLSPLWLLPSLVQVIPDYISQRTKQGISVPSWFLLEFLLWLSSVVDCDLRSISQINLFVTTECSIIVTGKELKYDLYTFWSVFHPQHHVNQGMMVHACDPKHSAERGRRIKSLRSSLATEWVED